VSLVGLEQTFYAEYPGLKVWLEKLRWAKTKQTLDTLADIWEIPNDQAATRATELVQNGFFELRGTRHSPEYWVPFLYRDALDMIQGAAE